MRTATATFSLHRRNGIFYVQFRNPHTNKWTTPKSTGLNDRCAATLQVAEWFHNGIPHDITKVRRPVVEIFDSHAAIEAVHTAPLTSEEAAKIVQILQKRGLVRVAAVRKGLGDVDFVAFLKEFWDFSLSPYVREKIAHGQRIGKRHCYSNTNQIKYWGKAFTGRMLSSITKADMRELSLSLADQGLSPSTINRVMLTGTTATRWAKDNNLLAIDPAEGLLRFSETHEKRGILTDTEIHDLFTQATWADERARVASLLAATTGLRQGEVRAVQVQDIGKDRLSVWAWSDNDGRKCPKNGETRTVPLLPEVRIF